MTIGFDQLNLEAAVSAVIKSAHEKGQKAIPRVGKRALRLSDAADVREYLIGRVVERYSEASSDGKGVRIACIEAVAYSPVGFVFEQPMAAMHPPPVLPDGSTGNEVSHLAYFWAVL